MSAKSRRLIIFFKSVVFNGFSQTLFDDVGHITGLAVDWLARNLYWVDQGKVGLARNLYWVDQGKVRLSRNLYWVL